jgi:hypothetical protein
VSGITNTFDIVGSITVWRAIKHILRPVEVLSAIRTGLWPTVEADKASLVGRGIIVADLLKDTPLVKFGQIALEIKFPKFLDVGCILRSPPTRVFSVSTA